MNRREFLEEAGRLGIAVGALPALRWAAPLLAEKTDPRLAELDRLLTGPLVRRGASGYAAAKGLFDTRFDAVSPLAIAYCSSVRDVQRAILWARRHGIRIAPRAGGHSYGGYSTTSGLVVDVTRLRAVHVDGAGKTATIGGGARLMDVYNALWQRRVTIPVGSCATVGVAGLTLGGGVGFASRKFGLTADNLVGATVVTADGRALACSATKHPDLFWALRGGGGGNFGVVTSFRFRVHPVDTVTTFSVEFPWAQARAAVQAWQSWAPRAPDDVFSVCGLRALDRKGGSPQVGVQGQFFGTQAQLQNLVQPLLAVPGARLSSKTRPYIEAVQLWAGCKGTAADCRERWTFKAKSDYANRPLSAAGIDTLIAGIERRQADPKLARGSVLLDSYGGAIGRVPKTATAFVHRDALFSLQYLAFWGESDPASTASANLDWIRGFYAQMRPSVSGFAYQNYIDPDLKSWPTAYYGSNYARLRRVKRKYDPKNVFRFAQSIRP